MAKKSLILYSSISGNTEKVALRFQEIFTQKGWECDLLKVTSKTDTESALFDLDQYDFVCAGSYVHESLPSSYLIDVMRRSVMQKMNVKAEKHPEPTEEEMRERLASDFDPHAGPPGAEAPGSKQIVFGPEDKRGVVFVTYAGDHLGPKEAVAPLALLESVLEHLRVQCVGTFACPGRFAGAHGWFKDLPTRPNENDLTRAEIFLAEILDETEWIYFPE